MGLPFHSGGLWVDGRASGDSFGRVSFVSLFRVAWRFVTSHVSANVITCRKLWLHGYIHVHCARQAQHF